MESKYVKCPRCRAVLLVKNTAGETTKQIVCPQCKASLEVSFMPSERQENNTETDSSTTEMADTRHSQAFVLTCNGTVYRLQPGENTIGRKSNRGLASIMVQTDDMYMSRNHAVIRISSLPSGGSRAVISNGNNKNPTLVNGQALQPGDEVFLDDGDEIIMGQTILKFATI